MAMPLNKKTPEIRSYYKPNKKEYEELRFVYRRFQEMKDARANHEKKWEKNWKQYFGYRPEKEREDWQSDIFIPLTRAKIEATLSEMVDQSPQPLILPREPNDVAQATVLKHAFKYTWDVGDGDIELYKILKSALVTGTAVAQEYVLNTPRKIQELIEFDPEAGVEKYEEKEISDFDDPYMEYVRNEDFYPDDRGRTLRGPYGLRDCIRRYIMHIDDLKTFFDRPVWNDLGNLKYVKPGGDINYYEFYKPPESINKENEIEVLWYWNKPDDKLIIVANDVVLRSSPNPYAHKQLPFARCVDIMKIDEFWGEGEADLLESLNEEINTHRRMRIDRNHLSIDQMFLKSAREDISESDLIVRPHGFIEVDDVENSVRPIQIPDLPRSAYLEEDRLLDDAQRVTGIDERATSVQTGGTATEAAILKEATLKRIRLKLRLMEKDFLVQIGRLRIANIQQFYSIPKMERVLGGEMSAKMQLELKKAEQKNRLRVIEGEQFVEKYRTIRIKDKELVEKEGRVIERPISGYSFFEVTPERIRANVDIDMQAGSTLPISKPLLQQRTETLAQHPLIQVGIETGIYDIAKIGDALLKIHDFNPDDFKTIEPGRADEEMEAQRLAVQEREIELANHENEQMVLGRPFGPTPYVSKNHTQLHLDFMKSDRFIRLPNDSPVIRIFVNHIAGEQEAQKRRGEDILPAGAEAPRMMGQPGAMGPMMPGMMQGKPTVSEPRFRGGGPQNENAALRNAIPGLVQGGGPSGVMGE